MRGSFPNRASQIARIIRGQLVGIDAKIKGLATLEGDARGKVVFIFRHQAYNGNSSCLVVKRRIDHSATQIIVPDPKYALYLFLKELSRSLMSQSWIGRQTTIGPMSVIGLDVVIGNHSVIGPGSVIQSARIGNGVTIGPGTIIGQPGFGFIKKGKKFLRMPHIGRVIIGNQVELGSNVVVDRGLFEDTIIGSRTKIDSSVHIGHNVKIGKDCVIIAQVGIGGSSVVGDRVAIAGQAGIKEGIRIGSNSKILAKAGVFKSFPRSSVISGIPAREHQRYLKAYAKLFKRSDE